MIARKRGRPAAASLTVVPIGEAIKRPEPPDELNDEAADEWRSIVSSLPADWFSRETHAMLEQLCRHKVAARRVAELIANFEQGAASDLDVQAYDRLLKMQERESRSISSLSTRMRISQQTTYDRTKRKAQSAVKVPWQR